MCRKLLWRLMVSCCCCLVGTLSWGQSDCPEAIVICSDGEIQFSPEAFTKEDDFANPNNDPGCLLTNEVRSVWYYFSFRSDMPADSEIEFTLIPLGTNPGDTLVDYDFAIYGPDLTCDSLGSPLRCSYARFQLSNECTENCNWTGLGMGATDTSEGAVNSDGFVAPMVVQPGQGFYMLIDNFIGDTDAFSLTWGGSAAPFLNCITDPACNQLGLVTAPAQNLCEVPESIDLFPQISGDNGNLTFSWSGDSLHYLSDTTSLTPAVIIPNDVTDVDLSFTITISQDGCSQTGSFAFDISPGPSLTLNPDTPPTLCPGDSVAIVLSDNFSNYQWSTGDTTNVATLMAGQDYSVTATAASGCQVIETVTVPEHVRPDFSILGDTSNCSNEVQNLVATTGFQSYQWSTGSTAETISFQGGGDFGLTITDNNDCLWETDFSVTELAAPTAIIDGLANICADTFSTLSLDQAYTSYDWSNSAMTSTIDVNQAGPYSVIVSDAQGCLDTANFNLAVNDLPNIDLADNAFFCPSTSLELQGPTGFNSYEWSNGGQNSQTTVDAVGLYSLTVTDNNGCQNSDQIQVNNHDLPSLEITGDDDFCQGQSTSLSASAGFTSYSWSDTQIGADITVAQAGFISVEVIDANGCIQQDSVEIVINPLPTPSLAVTPVICGGDDIEISLTETYNEYDWDNGTMDPTITLDQIGNYSVTVTDGNGCQGELNFDLNEFPGFALNIGGTPEICVGEFTDLVATPGLDTYEWSNGGNTSTISVTEPGMYELVATDNNGCQETASFNLGNFPDRSPTGPTEAYFCEQSSTILSVEGAEYVSYLWEGNIQSTTLEVSTAGVYQVALVDSNGCNYDLSIDVNSNPLPSIDIEGAAFFCEGNTTFLWGVSGPNTDFLWSDNTDQDTIIISNPGNYTLTVTDSMLCSSTAQIDVVENANPSPTIIAPEGFCTGENLVLEADADYFRYMWTGGFDTEEISISAGGQYGLTVTNQDGCTGSTNIDIEEWPLPNISLEGATNICEGSQTILSIIGDFDNLTWPDGSQETEWEVGTAGNYNVVARTDQGCETSLNFDIQINELPEVIIANPADINCDNGGVSLESIVTNVANPIYQWTGPGISNANENVANPFVTAAGNYSLIVTDPNTLCSSLPTDILVNSASIEVNPILSVNQVLSCFVEEVNISVELPGQANDYILEWTLPNNQVVVGTSFDFASQLAGTHQLAVTHIGTGCSGDISILVEENQTAPTLVTGAAPNLDCQNETVTLSLGIDADNQDYEVIWTLPDNNTVTTTEPTLTTDLAGLYQIRVIRQDNGCSVSGEITVVDLSEIPMVNILSIGQLDCRNETMQLSADGVPTGANWSFTWYLNGSLVGQSASLEVSNPGNYELRVVDLDNGCKNAVESLVERIDNGPQGLDIFAENESCFGDNDGSLAILTVNGGQAPYQFQLNDEPVGEIDIFNDLSPGNYVITVIDDQGCQTSQSAVINPGNSLDVILQAPNTIELGETLNLRAIPITSGQNISAYFWEMDNGLSCDNCDDRWSISDLDFGGIITVEITDEIGCTAEASTRVIVEKDYSVYIPNVFSPNDDGKNDNFTVFGDQEVEKIKHLLIVDRWGEVVFDEYDFPPNQLSEGWDGSFRGETAPLGVYVYMTEVEFVDGKTKQYTGDVTLIR